MQTIQLMVKNVYGNDLIYPVNSIAQELAKMINKKTFVQAHIKSMKELGFDVEYVPYGWDKVYGEW